MSTGGDFVEEINGGCLLEELEENIQSSIASILPSASTL